MFPSFRPDKFILIESDHFLPFIHKLNDVCDTEIRSYADLLVALQKRAHFFKDLGCRAADHGLEYISQVEYSEQEIDQILSIKLSGGQLSFEQVEKFKSAIMYDLGLMYYKLGWVQQFHLGASRTKAPMAVPLLQICFESTYSRFSSIDFLAKSTIFTAKLNDFSFKILFDIFFIL